MAQRLLLKRFSTSLCRIPAKQPQAGVASARYGECAEARSCLYEGESHAGGSSYPAADGCNTCSCQRDGTSACTEKACPEPRRCGGRATASCHDGEYCKFAPEAMCGRADATGVCMPKPTCSASGAVVCGCDGQNYNSECEAAVMGTGVLHRGFCNGCEYAGMTWQDGDELMSLDGCNTCTCDGATGEVHCGDRECPEVTCGGSTFMACPAFQFCDYTSSTSCGDLGTGTCKRAPDGTTCTAADEPVCGCDGMTYANECKAKCSTGVGALARSLRDRRWPRLPRPPLHRRRRVPSGRQLQPLRVPAGRHRELYRRRVRLTLSGCMRRHPGESERLPV